MKVKSLIALISLLLVACSNKEEIIYYEDGSIEAKIELKNDKLHGWSHYFYPNGSLEMKSSWKDNLQHGLTTIYHQNGKVKERTQWKNGKAHGWSEEHYSNGQLKKKVLNRNGHKVGSMTIFSFDGKPVETQVYNQKGQLIYVREYAEEDRGTEMFIPLFEDEKDTVSLGEEFRTTVSFAYPLKGEVKMLVGTIDKMNELIDTVAIVKPNKQGEFFYSFRAIVAGENTLTIKFVHKTSEGDTVSVNSMSVKHTYFVKQK